MIGIMKKRISNKEIQQAAALVRQAMLEGLDQEVIVEHNFSDIFQAEIQNLDTQDDKRRSGIAILKRCAAVIVLIALSVSTILMTSTDARAAIMAWFKEALEGQNLFHFQGKISEDNFPKVTLGWIPEGLKCTQNESDYIGFSLLYEDPTDPAVGFTLGGGYMSDGTTSIMGYDDGPHQISSVKVGELPGELYLSEDPANPSGLIWFDEENGVYFVMTSYYSPEIMERIAEGVVLVK